MVPPTRSQSELPATSGVLPSSVPFDSYAADHDRVALVIPTYNRADALRRNLPRLLTVSGISETVVVIDGGTDDTASVVRGFNDKRLKLVVHDSNRGQAAARNSGWKATKAGWILFNDDDDLMPGDHLRALMTVADQFDADVVGAPWLHLSPEEDPKERARDARAAATGGPSLRSSNSCFPPAPVVTPILPANALVRRSVLEKVSFEESYRGNGFREETDFFVSAASAGFRCVLTPTTYTWKEQEFAGGAHSMRRISYEMSSLANNLRFLVRHSRYLKDEGYISSVAASELQFLVDRLNPYVIAALRRLGSGSRRVRANTSVQDS